MEKHSLRQYFPDFCADDAIVNLAKVTVLEKLLTDEQGGMKHFGNYLGKERSGFFL